MTALDEFLDCPVESKSKRKSMQNKEDRQNQKPNWFGRLVTLALALLVGLFIFIHGCGKHDHDDELLFPVKAGPRPAGSPWPDPR